MNHEPSSVKFSVEITGDNGDVFYLSQSDPNQPTSLQGTFFLKFIAHDLQDENGCIVFII